MEVIERLSNQCRVASAFDAVQNHECVYSFHSPFTTDQGILVNLDTFAGTVDAMAMLFGSEQAVFVRIVSKRVEKELPPGEAEAAAAPTKLAIGVEGGFATEDAKYETISTHSVVALEKGADGAVKVLAELPYSEETKASFPEAVQKSVDSVLNHAGVSTQQQVQEWHGEETPVSKYCENLPFVDNGVIIDPDPKAWKCEKTGATENLWLNLSDGFIGGGRKHWDVSSIRLYIQDQCLSCYDEGFVLTFIVYNLFFRATGIGWIERGAGSLQRNRRKVSAGGEAGNYYSRHCHCRLLLVCNR